MLNMILRFLNKVEIYVHADDEGKSGFKGLNPKSQYCSSQERGAKTRS